MYTSIIIFIVSVVIWMFILRLWLRESKFFTWHFPVVMIASMTAGWSFGDIIIKLFYN